MKQSTDKSAVISNAPDKSDIASADSTLTSKGKKAYTTPTLTTYGSVSLLTQSGSQPNRETSPPYSPSRTRRRASDSRLKENIQLVGRHPLGIGLYLFDYKEEFRAECGYGRQFGVMAQEVEQVLPMAVLTTAAGYKTVDYAMLGIFPDFMH